MIVTADDILKKIPANAKNFFEKKYCILSITQDMMHDATFTNMTREELIETIRSIHDASLEAEGRLLNI